jgi:type II secretory pathway component PulJ
VGALLKAKRRGVSLVELVAVIIAGSALMGVTISVLVAIQRADQRFTRRSDQRQGVSRLIDQLRRDVRAADRVAWEAAANELTLDMREGGQVTYRGLNGRWERRVREGADGPSQLAGAFRLPAADQLTVQPGSAEAGALIRIAWMTDARPRDPRRAAAPGYEVAAVVGRDFNLLYP